MREKIEARLAELREIVAQTVWHEKQDAQIEVLEWVLEQIEGLTLKADPQWKTGDIAIAPDGSEHVLGEWKDNPPSFWCAKCGAWIWERNLFAGYTLKAEEE